MSKQLDCLTDFSFPAFHFSLTRISFIHSLPQSLLHSMDPSTTSFHPAVWLFTRQYLLIPSQWELPDSEFNAFSLQMANTECFLTHWETKDNSLVIRLLQITPKFPLAFNFSLNISSYRKRKSTCLLWLIP